MYVRGSILSLHMHNIPCASTSLQRWHSRLHNSLDPYVLTKYTCLYCHNRKISLFIWSYCNVLLSFMKTNYVSGYIITPLWQRHSTIFISQPILRLPLYGIHFNIYWTSPTQHLHTHKLPSETVSHQIPYLHTFNHMYILHLCPAFPKLKIPSLSLSQA